MTEKLPTIKFTETKIILKKNGFTETYSIKEGDEFKFIVHKGKLFKFTNKKPLD